MFWTVWLLAATRRYGYLADSSDFAAAAAGAATSTPLLLRRRSDCCLGFTPTSPSPVTADDPCVAGQCHQRRHDDLPALLRVPARAPLGRGVRPPTM